MSTLERTLRRTIRGEVLFDAASRGRYSTDASIYQVEPVGVVVPRDETDAARGRRRRARAPGAACCRAAPAPRSAARRSARRWWSTSRKHLREIIAFDRDARTVKVQPGVVLDAAQRLAAAARPLVSGRRLDLGAGDARRHGRQQLLRLALDRATATWCTTSPRSTRCSPTAPRRASATARPMAGAPAARRDASSRGWPRSPTRERDEIERAVSEGAAPRRRLQPRHLPSRSRERPYTPTTRSTFAHLLVGSEGTLAVTERLTLQLAPLAGAPHARRGELPELPPRDGQRPAHREARSRRRSSWSTAP